MNCLHCGDCCLRMSPLSSGACPRIIQKGTFIFCGKYKNRPKQCQNHAFHSRYCPIGLEKLNLLTPIEISKRIDEGYAIVKELGGE